MEPKKDKIFNPFEGRNREEVWKEITEKAVPTTREEAFRRMKEAAKMQRKNK